MHIFGEYMHAWLILLLLVRLIPISWILMIERRNVSKANSACFVRIFLLNNSKEEEEGGKYSSVSMDMANQTHGSSFGVR